MDHKKKLFISGRITGNRFYVSEFDKAEQFYRRKDYTVITPSVLPQGLLPADYMRICFAMIDSCDVVAFLPEWEMSPGARLEHAYCTYTGKPTLYYIDAPEEI